MAGWLAGCRCPLSPLLNELREQSADRSFHARVCVCLCVYVCAKSSLPVSVCGAYLIVVVVSISFLFHFFVRWQLDSYIYFKLHFWETATHAHIATHSLNNLWIVVFIVFVVICFGVCTVCVFGTYTAIYYIAAIFLSIYIYGPNAWCVCVQSISSVSIVPFLTLLLSPSSVRAVHLPLPYRYIYMSSALSEHIVCIYSDIAYSIMVRFFKSRTGELSLWFFFG